jgi:photosystem II stability/assembly factor-like uncharacterized protein
MRVCAATADGVWTMQENDDVWAVRHTQLHGRAFLTVAVSPHQADVIFAGADGHGIFRSVNGGGSWRPMSRGLESPYVVSIAFDAVDRRVVYAATLPPMLYRSVDGGETWEPLTNLPPAPAMVRPLQVVADPSRAGCLFVIDAGGGLQRTRDGGQSWQPDDLPGGCLHQIAAAPGVTLAACDGGLFRCADDEDGWMLVHPQAACAVSAVAAPSAWRGAGLLQTSPASTDLIGSDDGGRTWFLAAGDAPPDLRQIKLTSTLIFGITDTGNLWLAPPQGRARRLDWSMLSDEIPLVSAIDVSQ